MDPAGATVRPLPVGEFAAGYSFEPVWSPDGSLIAFVSMRSGAPELWLINADGTGLRQLTNDGQFVRWPVWRRP
jgi:TolB protein